jgi:membrane-bound serine protease (ClpP class)
LCVFLAFVLAGLCTVRAQNAPAPLVVRLDLDNIIHPLTAGYVKDGIDAAVAQHAAAVLIRLDTPGGLESSMREIIAKIIASPVPVIAWVGPAGSRAASAGFLVLISADLAAMAPGTNAGAAHPVLIGVEKMDEVTKQKLEQDAAAYIRSIAGKRERNVPLAEKAVLESKSFTETEALQNKLIDVIAASPEELLAKLEGATIHRFDGSAVTLHFKGARLVEYQAGERYRLLRRIIDPNMAFILLVIGALGLYIEFTHPGLIVPGVAGAILIVLAGFALSLLPINWAGALLIILAFAFFILEAKFMTHGVLTAGGIISMILGAMILINAPSPELRIRLTTALSVAVPFGLITVFLLRLAVRAWQSKVVTGEAGLLDLVGTAHTDLSPEGKIFIHGEIWNAVSSKNVARGARVRVMAVEGLLLRVEPEAEAAHAPVEGTRPRI